MDASLVTLIVGLLGGGTVATLVQFFVKRKDEKAKEESKQTKILRQLLNQAQKSELNDAQTHLIILINHYPKEHKAILAEAEAYLAMGGNSWVWGILARWAKDERVSISHLKTIHESNLKERNN